jgi:hypothetical protein
VVTDFNTDCYNYCVKIGYQETSSDDRDLFMCAAVTVTFGVYNSVRVLQLLVVATHKWSIDSISNSKPRPEALTRDSI